MEHYRICDSAFLRMILPNAELETLGEGFRWLEGPVWFPAQQTLLFSDIPNNRVMRWVEGGVSTFRAPSHFENGHARDREGRLVSCSHHARCITRTEHDGTITLLAGRYEGKRLNSPNDVIVKSDGSIWFTDPPYGINTDYEGGKQNAELAANVYRLSPEDGSLEIVASDVTGPNGLCFSPDESLLYIAESGVQFDARPVQHIRAFELTGDGKRLRGGTLFHKVEPGFTDGIRCDEHGNVWSSAGDGVHCISPSGKLLGKILTGGTVSNLTFGGRNNSRLFICAGARLLAIYTNSRGAEWP